MKKENLSEDTDKQCLGNREMEDCLNQQSNMYVTKQGQLRKIDGYDKPQIVSTNWKQLKDK